MMRLDFLAIVMVAGVLSSCGENNSSKLTVSQAEFGDSWPLTVSSGYLECWKKNAVLFHTGGRTYAVNGTALGWRHQEGWRDIKEIWADDPRPGYVGKDIGPLLDRGLSLC